MAELTFLALPIEEAEGFPQAFRLSLAGRTYQFRLYANVAEELLDAAKLIDTCPDTRFVLDHCGNAKVQAKDRRQWEKDIAAVAKRKNVVGKVSGIVVGARLKEWKPEDLAPIVKHTLEVFGPERVMFGGDWPVCTKTATLRQWVAALRSIVSDRPRAEQKKLFHDNAIAFYGLSK